MKNRIRIESHDNVVRDAKIFYVPEEGDEVDISRCVTGVDLHLHVGDVASATLHTVFVDGIVSAEVEDVITRRLGSPRHFRRLRRFWWHSKSEVKAWIARSLSDEVRREIARTARKRKVSA